MKRLKEHAERDFLTDLLNTRAFDTRAHRATGRRGAVRARARRRRRPQAASTTAKATLGGDDHLRRLAAVPRQETAPEDTVARIGGDEFAILASGDGEALAHQAARCSLRPAT